MSPRKASAPTILDVAARAGVSKSSVSRVLRNSAIVSPESREAVLRAIDELGYLPNSAARTLVRRQSNVIGVHITDLRNPLFAEIVEGIEPIARAHRYTLIVSSAKPSYGDESSVLNKLLELRIDGLICDAAKLDRRTLRDAARSTPVAILTRTPELPRVDSVVTNDRAGAALVVEYLAGLGHRRISFVADVVERAGLDRIRGYKEAMTRLNLADEIEIVPAGFTEADGYEAARRLLDGAAPPTAIFAANDFAALGVLEAASDARVEVPAELSVVGYDDVRIASFAGIALTTVHQSARKIGEAAIEAVLARIREPDRPARRVVLPPRLVERATAALVPIG